MHRNIIALFLAITFVISGCTKKQSADKSSDVETSSTQSTLEKLPTKSEISQLEFDGLEDGSLRQFLEANVYANTIKALNSDKYAIINVESVYLSKEYIEELEYNSKQNIYFGYNIQTLEEQFEGEKYVFTVGDDSKTIVKAFEKYDDTYEKALKNIAIGTGVILVCVTISVATGGTAPAVSAIFAVSAKSATVLATESAVMGGLVSGITTAIQTKGDVNKILKSAALNASEDFKIGALIGSITGGVMTGIGLHGATTNGLTMNEVAKIQKESGYPLDVIKQIKSIDEYNVYKSAGLKPAIVGKRVALIRDIDLNYKSEYNGKLISNLERMKQGLAPIESTTGKAYQLHHINQSENGTLAILTESEHKGNSKFLNVFGKSSEIDRDAFDTVKKAFWKSLARMLSQ